MSGSLAGPNGRELHVSTRECEATLRNRIITNPALVSSAKITLQLSKHGRNGIAMTLKTEPLKFQFCEAQLVS